MFGCWLKTQRLIFSCPNLALDGPDRFNLGFANSQKKGLIPGVGTTGNRSDRNRSGGIVLWYQNGARDCAGDRDFDTMKRDPGQLQDGFLIPKFKKQFQGKGRKNKEWRKYLYLSLLAFYLSPSRENHASGQTPKPWALLSRKVVSGQ